MAASIDDVERRHWQDLQPHHLKSQLCLQLCHKHQQAMLAYQRWQAEEHSVDSSRCLQLTHRKVNVQMHGSNTAHSANDRPNISMQQSIVPHGGSGESRVYQLGVASQVCQVLVQRHILLCSSSLHVAHSVVVSQHHTTHSGALHSAKAGSITAAAHVKLQAP